MIFLLINGYDNRFFASFLVTGGVYALP